MIRRYDDQLARQSEVEQLDVRVRQRTLRDVVQRLGEKHIRRFEVSVHLYKVTCTVSNVYLRQRNVK